MAHHLVTLLMYGTAPVVVYALFFSLIRNDKDIGWFEILVCPLCPAAAYGGLVNLCIWAYNGCECDSPLANQTLVDAGIDSKSRKLMIFTCPHVDDQYRVLWQKNGSDVWHTYPSSSEVWHSDRWFRDVGQDLWRPKETWDDNAPATLDNPSKRTISDAQLAEYCANASEEFPEISERRARVDAFVGDVISFRWVNHNLLVVIFYLVWLAVMNAISIFWMYALHGKFKPVEIGSVAFITVAFSILRISDSITNATGITFTDDAPSIDLLTPLSSAWSWLLGWVPQAILTAVVCWLVMAWRGGGKSVVGVDHATGNDRSVHTVNYTFNASDPPVNNPDGMTIPQMVEALRKCKEKEEKEEKVPYEVRDRRSAPHEIIGDWFGSPKTDPPPPPSAPPAPPAGVVEKAVSAAISDRFRELNEKWSGNLVTGNGRDMLSEDSSQLAREIGVEPVKTSKPTGVDYPL